MLLPLAVLVAVVGAGAAEARQKKTKEGPWPDLPSQVSDLAWKLRGLHMDESGEITGKIQKLVLDDLQEWIADRNVSSVEARRQLEHAFAKLRYPTFAWPKCFAETWKGNALVGAGYTLGWTNFNRVNVVALFERSEGKTRLVATTPFVPYTDINYEVAPARGSDDFWFFVYGTRPGKSHPRLSAILYAYDGQTLKSLWETRDVYDGKMDVSEDRVTIRYLKESEFIYETTHGRKPPRHEAIYRLTPKGLELESDHEIPF